MGGRKRGEICVLSAGVQILDLLALANGFENRLMSHGDSIKRLYSYLMIYIVRIGATYNEVCIDQDSHQLRSP